MADQKYEILEEVNSGLYGKVFKARQIKLNRIVAAKIIKNDYPQAADELKHAEALARVDHDNIVKVIDVDEVEIPGLGKVSAAIMQWLDGELLGMKFSGEPFTAEQARQICFGVLDGVACMHENGLCHRDLHFGNIIITPGFTPKIIDIDVNQDVTLARLSTMSRGAAVNADIGHVRQIVLQCMRHARLSNVLISDADDELRVAGTLAEVRRVVERAFVQADRPTVPSVMPTQATVTLAETVTSLIEDQKPVSLRNLVIRSLKEITDELVSDKFTVQGDLGEEDYRNRVLEYEAVVGPMLPVLAAGAYWGTELHSQLWRECIEAVANIYEDYKSWGGKSRFIELRQYPPLLMLYAAGMGAYLGGKYSTLRVLLRETEFRHMKRVSPLADALGHWKAEARDIWNDVVLPNSRSRAYTPISDHLMEITQIATIDLSLLRTGFESQFDRFEYFFGLVHSYGDAEMMKGVTRPTRIEDHSWGAYGSFLWRTGRRGNDDDLGAELLEKATLDGSNSPELQAGFFNGSLEELGVAIKRYDNFLQLLRNQFHIF